MSPARRSVNPQQEALDLGLPEPAPNKSAPVKAASAKSAWGFLSLLPPKLSRQILSPRKLRQRRVSP